LISTHFGESVSGPEKAGVGGSIPSLATINFNNLAIAKNIQNSSRVQYANIRLANVRGVRALWFKDLPKFARCAAGASDMFPRQLRIAFCNVYGSSSQCEDGEERD
jgi:hypothetical protein